MRDAADTHLSLAMIEALTTTMSLVGMQYLRPALRIDITAYTELPSLRTGMCSLVWYVHRSTCTASAEPVDGGTSRRTTLATWNKIWRCMRT